MQPAANVVIRQPAKADGQAIEAMFANCSLESRYARFPAPLGKIPADDLAGVLALSRVNEGNRS